MLDSSRSLYSNMLNDLGDALLQQCYASIQWNADLHRAPVYLLQWDGRHVPRNPAQLPVPPKLMCGQRPL